MKSNKQRAEIIMQRANSIVESGSTIKEEKKKVPLWKIVTAVTCSILILLGTTLGLIFGLADLGYNIDKMFIANFSNYTAIGSGYIDSTSGLASAATMPTVASKGVMIANAASNASENYLIGQKKDGSFEKISFSNTQNGKPEKQQKGKIVKFHAYQNYTVFQWTSDVNYTDDSGYVSIDKYFYKNGNYHKIFVIDNRTGKIFDLASVGENQFNFFNDLIYGFDSLDSGDCFYLYHGNKLSSNGEQKYYKVSVVQGILKVEEVISSNTIDFVSGLTFTDKYGNLFLTTGDASYYNTTGYVEVKYCISNGNVKDINKNVFRSVNGIVYTEDKLWKVDENGNFVSNDFMDCDLILSKENSIKKVGDVEYFYGKYNQRVDKKYMENIYEVTWIDEERFSYKEIPLDDYSENFVITNDKIYFLREEDVFSAMIENGNQEKLVADYVFNSIATDNLGNVVFTAITKQDMNSVKGIISNDGKIDISQTKRKYVVYYIKAVN